MRGSATTDTVLASATGVVDRDRPNKPDKPSIEQFASDVRHALDEHLTDLGQGGPGTLDPLRADQLPDLSPALTSQLATSERWVEAAEYTFTVGHAGAPLWARVMTHLVRNDGSTASSTLVFIPDDDGDPRLVAWEATMPDAPAPRTFTRKEIP